MEVNSSSQKRVVPSFLAQFRAVFLKNLTLQARQRVSLVFQLLPLLGLLIAAAAPKAQKRTEKNKLSSRSTVDYETRKRKCLSGMSSPPVVPPVIPNCDNDQDGESPICWGINSRYINGRDFSKNHWDRFWFHDSSAGKLAGNLSRTGPLGPSFNGVLGYTQQFFIDLYWMNQYANVPFFEEKPSWLEMFNEYQSLQNNLSLINAANQQPWRCRPYGPTDPPFEAYCEFSVKLPEAGVTFNSIEKNKEGIQIDYSIMNFPALSFDTPNYDLLNFIQIFHSMILRWSSDYQNPNNENTYRINPNYYNVVYRTYMNFPINGIIQLCFWLIGFGLLIPFFMSKLVIERGSGLMEVSKMAGLSTTAYWFSIIVQDLIQVIVALLVCVIIGLSTGFLSLLHGGFVMYFGMFAYGFSIMSLSYLFSMCFKSPNWAYFFGYLLGLGNAGLVLPLNFLLFGSGDLPAPYFLWFPPLSASRAIFVIVHACEEPYAASLSKATGTAWMCCLWSVGFSCVLILLTCLPDFIRETIQRSSKGSGTALPPKFNSQHDEKILIDEDRVDLEDEQDSVPLFNVLQGHQLPLSIKNVSKAFVNENGDLINAVNNVSFQIFKGDCFGLLGPNGAGKTTLVNMLVGLLDVSSGDAFIDGHSIITDITGVQNSIGLCPQFDVHYEDLTVQEHLLYYSRLWGYTRSNERQHVKEIIHQIGLHDEKHRKAGSLSGGQKRRLSIGIALSGNPPLVLLDEPSSGLDVGSQRAVWDIICNARKNQRSFLLTTHSMNEAEVLCNRIGIMSQGRLKVSGTPQELKRKYGSGFKIDMLVDTEFGFFLKDTKKKQKTREKKGIRGAQELKRKYGSGFKIDMLVDTEFEEDMKSHPAHKFILSLIPTAELVSSQNGYLTFQIPKSVKLSKLLTQIEIGKKPNRIINWGISQSNLQEVFLALTRGDNTGQDVLNE